MAPEEGANRVADGRPGGARGVDELVVAGALDDLHRNRVSGLLRRGLVRPGLIDRHDRVPRAADKPHRHAQRDELDRRRLGRPPDLVPRGTAQELRDGVAADVASVRPRAGR